MKVRDSGMPDEEMWTGFFDPARVLAVFAPYPEERLRMQFADDPLWGKK